MNVPKDRRALLEMMKSCGEHKEISIAKSIHAHVVQREVLHKDICLCNALISMYAKCDALLDAIAFFENLPCPNVVSWNSIMSIYYQHGLHHQALSCFKHMQSRGQSPNVVTYICILKCCSNIGFIKNGQEIHAIIIMQTVLRKHLALGNVLVHMYAKCGMLREAQDVFEELPERDVVSWSSLISGYGHHQMHDKALKCFWRMQHEDVFPDVVTFLCILKSCTSIEYLEMGEKIHALIIRHSKSIMLDNTLVDMYAKCEEMGKAREMFDEIPKRDVVTWNALIMGYIRYGLNDEVLKCFKMMQEEDDIFPDAVTFICILKACGNMGLIGMGEEIHIEVRNNGLIEKDILLGTTLVDMYAKMGMLEKAKEVFEEDLPIRNVVSWNAMVSGYTQHGHSEEALKCFRLMQYEGISPDVITFICMLKACGSMGSVAMGEEVHVKVKNQQLWKKDMVLGNALVDMYAKCGMLGKAQEVFNELPCRDVISWSALMDGYAQMGEAEKVIENFNKMMIEDVIPDVVTFLVLLTACNHAGLLAKGLMVFNAMYSSYAVTPTLDHFTCMVDFLVRVGHFDKALDVIENVSPSYWLPLLLTLLGACCCNCMNVDIARWAFEQLLQLDKECVSAYVCMGNIYASSGMHEELTGM